MQHYKKCASTVQRACATRYRTTACEQRHAHHLQLGEKEIKLAADTKSGPQRSRRCQAGAALMMQHRVSFRGRDENAHMLHLIYLCNLKQARRLRSTTIWHTHRSRWPGTRAEAGAGLSSVMKGAGGHGGSALSVSVDPHLTCLSPPRLLRVAGASRPKNAQSTGTKRTGEKVPAVCSRLI